LTIKKWKSEPINRRRTSDTTDKRKRTIVVKIIHIQLKIEKQESN